MEFGRFRTLRDGHGDGTETLTPMY